MNDDLRDLGRRLDEQRANVRRAAVALETAGSVGEEALVVIAVAAYEDLAFRRLALAFERA